MKKKLLLILLLSFITTLFSLAQQLPKNQKTISRHKDKGEPNTYKIISGDTLNKSDKNGELQGKWKRTHTDGSFKCQGVYKDGYKSGYWERKWPNGNWRYQLNMNDGYYNGYCKFYFENGKLEKEGNYKMGKEDGKIKTYFKNGIIESEETFSDGVLNGSCQYFNEASLLIIKGSFLNNNRDGLWIFYSPKTQKLSAQTTMVEYVKGQALSTTISTQ